MKSKTNSIGLALVLSGLILMTGCKKEPEAESLPLVAATTATEITVNSALLNGTIIAKGSSDVTARGFCWSTTPDPDISDNQLSAGNGIGQFTGRITGLLPGTDYHVRSWATNFEGTSYGTAEIISTPLTVSPAALTTIVPEYLESTSEDYIVSGSVVSGGVITDIGGGEITERGICWSPDPSPTIENHRVKAPVKDVGLGSFTLVFSGLEPGETYYLKAYAINSAGVSYGPEISFKTLAILGNKRTDFPGEARNNAVSFSIGNKLYIGLGSIATAIEYGTEAQPLKDLWEWDQVTNQWTMLAPFPGNNFGAVGFTLGGKGYVFTSGWYYTEEGVYASELWEYDPATNRWTGKSDFPVIGIRLHPEVFSIGSKAYIGLGHGWGPDYSTRYYTDLWEWDQNTDRWTEKTSFPGLGRSGAVAFSIGNKGYVGTGDRYGVFQEQYTGTGDPIWFQGSGQSSSEGPLLADFWEYDQQADRWTQKADFSGGARSNAFSFSIDNKGYIGAGYHDNLTDEFIQDFWEYDHVLDRWYKIGLLAGGKLAESAGSVGDNGFFIAGATSGTAPVELWIFPLSSDK